MLEKEDALMRLRDLVNSVANYTTQICIRKNVSMKQQIETRERMNSVIQVMTPEEITPEDIEKILAELF